MTIEAYAFVAVFMVQILAMSVLHPAWFTRYVRLQMENYYPDERFAQLYPDTERSGVERLLTRYRVLNAAIAALGLLLLTGLFNYMRRPDWSDGPVETLVGLYFGAQLLPLLLAGLIAFRSNRQALKRLSTVGKRKAILQRRVLFDFVSPLAVALAILCYVLFAMLVVYIQQDPFPHFAGYLNIGIVSLVYALHGFVVYTKLYGRKSSPLETREDRARWTGVIVKVCVYSCISCVVFLSINFTLVLLDLQRWEPFAQSISLVICAFLCSMGLTGPPRRPEAAGFGSSPVP